LSAIVLLVLWQSTTGLKLHCVLDAAAVAACAALPSDRTAAAASAVPTSRASLAFINDLRIGSPQEFGPLPRRGVTSWTVHRRLVLQREHFSWSKRVKFVTKAGQVKRAQIEGGSGSLPRASR
jgi:hypothetical protein